MTQELDLKRIEIRQREIKAQIDALQQESEELVTTLRVLQRFASPPGSARARPSSTGMPRPDGVPTIYKMVESVLTSAAARGMHGLTGREIVDQIADRFWPGAVDAQIQPSLYRFKKAGRLHKNKAGKFAFGKKNEAPPNKSGDASRFTGEVQASPNDDHGRVLTLHG